MRNKLNAKSIYVACSGLYEIYKTFTKSSQNLIKYIKTKLDQVTL